MFSRWATEEEIKDWLVCVDKNGEDGKSGIPLYYDGDSIFINNTNTHNVVVGNSEDNQKDNVIIPFIKLAIKANESIIVNDVNDYTYNDVISTAEDNNYNIIKLNIGYSESDNHINPLEIAYNLYKDGKKSEAFELMDIINNYIFYEDEASNDPFWINMCRDLFVATSVYLFNNEEVKNINIKKVHEIIADFDNTKHMINDNLNDDEASIRYMNIYNAPKDTLLGILSVFKLRLGLFVSKVEISNLLSSTDFNASELQNDNTIVFINHRIKSLDQRIVSMLFDVLYYVNSMDTKEKRLNVIIDNFTNIKPINDLSIKLCEARTINIRFTLCANSISELHSLYGKDDGLTIFSNCSNIIYLASNDYNTLELMSNLCGKDKKNKPLIGIQALQSLKSNQALVLINRMYPFITDINNDKVFVERTEHAEYIGGIQINTTVKDNKYRKFFDCNIPVPFYDEERDVQEYVIGNEDEVRVLYNLQSAFTRETNALLYYPCVHRDYDNDEIKKFSANTFDGILMNVYNFPESFKINEKDKCYYSFQELKFINQIQSYLLFIGLKDIESREFKLDRYKNDVAKDLKGTSKLYVNNETIEKMLNGEINYFADKFIFKYEDGTYPEFEPFNALIFDEEGKLKLYVKFIESENKLYKDIKDEYYLKDFDEEKELKDDAEVDIIHFEIIKKA